MEYVIDLGDWCLDVCSSDIQTTAIILVTDGIDQIYSVVQTNSATAEESAAASEELSAEADSLKKLVDRFTLARD